MNTNDPDLLKTGIQNFYEAAEDLSEMLDYWSQDRKTLIDSLEKICPSQQDSSANDEHFSLFEKIMSVATACLSVAASGPNIAGPVGFVGTSIACGMHAGYKQGHYNKCKDIIEDAERKVSDHMVETRALEELIRQYLECQQNVGAIYERASNYASVPLDCRGYFNLRIFLKDDFVHSEIDDCFRNFFAFASYTTENLPKLLMSLGLDSDYEKCFADLKHNLGSGNYFMDSCRFFKSKLSDFRNQCVQSRPTVGCEIGTSANITGKSPTSVAYGQEAARKKNPEAGFSMQTHVTKESGILPWRGQVDTAGNPTNEIVPHNTALRYDTTAGNPTNGFIAHDTANPSHFSQDNNDIEKEITIKLRALISMLEKSLKLASEMQCEMAMILKKKE